MKTLKNLTFLFATALLATSCVVGDFNRVNGNKNVIEDTRKINNDFTKIKASNGLDVYVTQSKSTELTIEADENLHDIIKTEVENGVLRIYAEKNIHRAKARKIYVSAPIIEAITASSGSDVYSKNTIMSNNFVAKASSGADLQLDLDVKSLESSSSSGSDIKLKGKAGDYSASASSGSSTRAYGLIAKNVTASASSGADIDVYATETLNAKASSGGDVDYKGSPELVNRKANSGGSVSSY